MTVRLTSVILWPVTSVFITSVKGSYLKARESVCKEVCVAWSDAVVED